MKKVLGISLVALFTVAPFAADAALTSKGYVDGKLELKQDKSTAVKFGGSDAVGSATNPVYIDAQGNATAITSYEGNAATATKATKDASGNTITDTYQRIDNMVTKGTETGDDANKYPSIQKVESIMTAYSANVTALEEKEAGDVEALQADIDLLGGRVNGKVDIAQGTPNAKKIAGTKSDGTVVFVTPAVSGSGNVVSSVSVSDAGALTLNKDVNALTEITTGTATGSGTVVKGVSASGSTVTATMGTISDADVATGAEIAQSKISGLTDALNAKATVTALEAEVTRADTAEKANAAAIASEASRADTAEKANAKAISDEEIRAKAAEKANADAIDAINNETTGILASAKADATTKANAAESSAKAYTDTLANGQVKTNKEAIEAINDTTTGILKSAKDYADGLAGNYDVAGAANTAESNAKSYVDDLKDAIDASLGALAHLEIPTYCTGDKSTCVLVYKGPDGFVLEDIERANDELDPAGKLNTLPKQS